MPINDDAALVYDAGLDDDPELIEAVTAAATIALESRARLERIVTAGDDERRRLERDLHDGAQQRLVALAMQLRLIQHEIQADPAAAQQLVDSASEELRLSMAELRELARGIHPAVLNHGLEPALQSLAGQATVPTDVAYAAEGELPEQVELAAYFVTSEALANVGKYARASSASVDVTRTGGGLVVRIADDGVGGADASRGSGLRGLADRVEALDGRLRVESPPGARHRRDGGAAVRVVIADDSLLVREGIASLLRRAGVDVVAEADDGEQLVRAVDEHAPDVGDRRRADAADAHRGGPRGGARDPRAPPGHRDPRALPARRGRRRDARARRDARRGSATCSRSASPTSTTSRARCATSRRAARRSTRRSCRGCSPTRAATGR